MYRYILITALLATLVGSACKKEQTANDLPLENTHWQLHKIIKNNEIEVIAASIVITAVFIAGNLTGSGGCNDYLATYTVNGDQLFTGLISSTLKSCAGAGSMEGSYFNALQTSQSWEIDGATLKIKTADTLLFFEAQ